MAAQLFGPVITTGPDTPVGRKAPPTLFTYNEKLHPQLFLCVRWSSDFLVGWKWKIQHPQRACECLCSRRFKQGQRQYKQLPQKTGGRGKTALHSLTAKLAFANWKPRLSAQQGQMGATHCDRLH